MAARFGRSGKVRKQASAWDDMLSSEHIIGGSCKDDSGSQQAAQGAPPMFSSAKLGGAWRPAASAARARRKRPAAVALGDPSDAASKRQAVLDFGQRSVGGHVSCATCGMVYARGAAAEEAQHTKFCAEYQAGVAFHGWKSQRVVHTCERGHGGEPARRYRRPPHALSLPLMHLVPSPPQPAAPPPPPTLRHADMIVHIAPTDSHAHVQKALEVRRRASAARSVPPSSCLSVPSPPALALRRLPWLAGETTVPRRRIR